MDVKKKKNYELIKEALLANSHTFLKIEDLCQSLEMAPIKVRAAMQTVKESLAFDGIYLINHLGKGYRVSDDFEDFSNEVIKSYKRSVAHLAFKAMLCHRIARAKPEDADKINNLLFSLNKDLSVINLVANVKEDDYFDADDREELEDPGLKIKPDWIDSMSIE